MRRRLAVAGSSGGGGVPGAGGVSVSATSRRPAGAWTAIEYTIAITYRITATVSHSLLPMIAL